MTRSYAAILCRDKLASHGAADSSVAAVLPIPSSTRTDGSAQQNKVLNELNSEK